MSGSPLPPRFQPKCLSLDLEVNVADERIREFAAVRGDTDATFAYPRDQKNPDLALAALDALADGAAFLLGHNLIAFDLPHLKAAKPDLRLFDLPAVDTLRLNPLAFPRNPYHHLVKHYQDGQLQRGRLNDPELDARLTLEVFGDQHDALLALNASEPDLVLAWHWLATGRDGMSGLNAFFSKLRGKLRPADDEAKQVIGRFLAGRACVTTTRDLLDAACDQGWPLAYALAWISVAGGNSVMPPWVRHQFPEAGARVRRLRDTACTDPACSWCREHHDAGRELKRWFGFDAFRPEPADANGQPLQRVIVEAAMAGRHVLGILPTGTGKSLCYQIPALSRFDKTGALTVVISPLVALMADQVKGLEARGVTCCASINGLLSMPERRDVLDRVRLGDVGILIVSPEQLRGKAVRRVLDQREIGAWVLDEAHCLSKWGHDFRPDYRYVGRFIKQKAGANPVPPVLCLTATAKPDVVADIVGYFGKQLGITLDVFDGGSERSNLDFVVVPTTPGEKFEHVFQTLMQHLPPEQAGGAIVYCASQKRTEEIAAFLGAKGVTAGFFHAGLKPEAKKTTQARFIDGELRVIAATNAFGMGIDKPDVRLVVHADIPGSLENYLQEAGRAGRDRAAASCVLLYTPEDVERQFGLSARSRLTQREIQAILKALRKLDRKKNKDGEIVVTAGEILSEDDEAAFQRDSATDDTRVRTAIAWLEEAKLLAREENAVQIYPSSLRVKSTADAHKKLASLAVQPEYQRQLLAVVETLIGADPDEGVSTDELTSVSGLDTNRLRGAFYDLERLGIANNDTALTAYVHAGVVNASRERFERVATMEKALIGELRLAAPDLAEGESSALHLRQLSQRLKDAGLAKATPDQLLHLLKSLAKDGRNEENTCGSLHCKKRDAETVTITLLRKWSALDRTASLRREAAGVLLGHLLDCLPTGQRGTDLLAATTLGKLNEALRADMALMAQVNDPETLLDLTLLWLHEQDIVRLNKGLAVFRPAMTIQLEAEKRGFAKADFAQLEFHYTGQVSQIHVMAEYARLGLVAMTDALRLAMSYFSLDWESFIKRWLPERDKELARQTTPASWRAIVEDLDNPIQQRIVADDRAQSSVLVLAGPGSGKTRVLVHRIAYLVRARRENPRGIVALAYNRHAAVEIRKRLHTLIGDDAHGVTVMTCHALAMRLVGASFAERARQAEQKDFDAILREAVALLEGRGLPPDDADDARDRLLAGFNWILVDEYQDVGADHYALISALAGRTQTNPDAKLSLFAVGDDDQNIYAFNGASVEYIRHFAADYAAQPVYLTENYRSTAHIIAAANALIAVAPERMKADHPITVNRARRKASPGGDWQARDPVAQGRVQMLAAVESPLLQALAAMTELERLAALDPDWNWARVAVIARNWDTLDPVRAYCEQAGIAVQTANEPGVPFWALRETRALRAWLKTAERKLIDAAALRSWLNGQIPGRWTNVLADAVEDYARETGESESPREHFIEWLAEWGRELRRRQTGVLLVTAHSAKGLEFDHVVVLDGGWGRRNAKEDPDASRRLLYVAVTRARQTLTLTRLSTPENPYLADLARFDDVLARQATALPAPPGKLARQYRFAAMNEIDLGYAGRQPSTHPIHQAIAALKAGDALHLREEPGDTRCLLTDRAGVVVGRLAKAFGLPQGAQIVSVSVVAICARLREDEGEAYRKAIVSDQWEYVVPELVFE